MFGKAKVMVMSSWKSWCCCNQKTAAGVGCGLTTPEETRPEKVEETHLYARGGAQEKSRGAGSVPRSQGPSLRSLLGSEGTSLGRPPAGQLGSRPGPPPSCLAA